MKQEELLERLKKFALDVLNLIKELPATEENKIYGKQVIRSSSSIGANYAEATCAFTTPDFLHDLNKSRKESKESIYWLDLLNSTNPTFASRINILTDEAQQLHRIFTASVKTVKFGKE